MGCGEQFSKLRASQNALIQKYNELSGARDQQVNPVTSMLDATGMSRALSQVRMEDETDCKRVSQDRDRLEKLTECKICFAQQRGIVFLPCSHFVACESCSGRMNECPMC